MRLMVWLYLALSSSSSQREKDFLRLLDVSSSAFYSSCISGKSISSVKPSFRLKRPLLRLLSQEAVHQRQEEGVLLVAPQHLLQQLLPALVLLGRLLLLLGRRAAAGLRLLPEEVEDLERRVGAEGFLSETEGEVVLGLGDCSDALLDVLLALLLDLVQLEEELLGVGAHLRGGARLNSALDELPVLAVRHECWMGRKVPVMKRWCSWLVQRPSVCGSSDDLESDSWSIEFIQSILRPLKQQTFKSLYNLITRMKMVKALLAALLLLAALADIPHLNKKQIMEKIDSTKINYGSTIRIKAAAFPYYLHSHNVNYPRGSGQQSVTGFPMDDDYNSLWTIKESHRESVKTYYHELKCGDTIRLEHALTKRNLHSDEIFQSLITQGQEVSAFGEGGSGDDNDNWVLQCKAKQAGEPFYGGDLFELVHENTAKRLKMSRYYEYKFDNWENCPFQGQIEVSGSERATRETDFKIVGGVFFKDKAEGRPGEEL